MIMRDIADDFLRSSAQSKQTAETSRGCREHHNYSEHKCLQHGDTNLSS